MVSGAKHISDQITSRINLWNKGAYDELVQESHGVSAAYLGKARGNQNWEQRHCNFLNFILCGKLRETVWFIFEQ